MTTLEQMCLGYTLNKCCMSQDNQTLSGFIQSIKAKKKYFVLKKKKHFFSILDQVDLTMMQLLLAPN